MDKELRFNNSELYSTMYSTTESGSEVYRQLYTSKAARRKAQENKLLLSNHIKQLEKEEMKV